MIYKNKRGEYIYPITTGRDGLIYIKEIIQGIRPVYKLKFIYGINKQYGRLWNVVWKKITDLATLNIIQKFDDKGLGWILKGYNHEELVFEGGLVRPRKSGGGQINIPYLAFVDGPVTQEIVNIWRQYVNKINKDYIMRWEDFVYCFSFLDGKKTYPYKPAKYCDVRAKMTGMDKKYDTLFHELRQIYRYYLVFVNEGKDPNSSYFKKTTDNGELGNCAEIYKKIKSVGFTTNVVKIIEDMDKTKYPRTTIKDLK